MFDYQKGGTGSAHILSKYVINIVDGLVAKDISVCEPSSIENDEYTLELLNEFAKKSNTAVMAISRLSGEGKDRNEEDFNLNDEEEKLLDALDKSDFEKVVVVLNIGGIINVASIKAHPKVKAILLAWQPGMDGGSAIADVLCGDVTPSGKLTDTFALCYEDYPSSAFFNESYETIYYSEDIFVGYRYFETFAKDKVLYPFGFGLSYTSFSVETSRFFADNKKISLDVIVTNTGNMDGREVIQIYSSAPKGDVPKSTIELRTYKKTKSLKPGESETITLSFNTSDMAYFSEEKAAFVLDKGEYNIYAGTSVRDISLCGTYMVNNDTITMQTNLKFTSGLPCKITSDGTFENTNVYNKIKKTHKPDEAISAGDEEHINIISDESADVTDNKYSLYDVSEGRVSLDEFIRKMTDNQLINLAQAQPPAFPKGTAGIGNISALGIPNPQTADGPAGVRRSVPTTCFPCATLLACTWDEVLLENVGKVMGDDGISNDVDILLAPGLNIHRNPLCGRNFEYYSEDPLVSGKCAAAIVRGVQSRGLGATIKHFAFNNKEANRHFSNSVISERAIREIYLKGFEIAVKEGNPWCVMTAYNKVNGTYTSTNYNLLTGMLREEWGYDGMVMTDWRVDTHLWEEVIAGNNIKMPYGYPEEIQLATYTLRGKQLTRERLEENAKYILNLIMKTKRFKDKNFGLVHNIDNNITIKALDFTCVSGTWAGSGFFDNGDEYLSGIGLDQRGNEMFVYYMISTEKGGKFALELELSCAYDGIYIEVYIDDEKLTELKCDVSEFNLENPFKVESDAFDIQKGEHELKLYIRGSKDKDSVHISKFTVIRK